MKIGITGHKGFIGKIIWDELSKNRENELFGIRSDKGYTFNFGLDILIHCARSDKNIMNKNFNLFQDLEHEHWINEYKTDVVLPYELTKASLNPNLKHVIFISSIYGKKIPTIRKIPPNYVTCKAAELHLMKYLAWEIAPVQVNAVVLGGVKSDRPAADQSDDFLKKYNDKTLVGHMVTQEEVIGAVEFLISNKSKGITGQEIIVDGGYSII